MTDVGADTERDGRRSDRVPDVVMRRVRPLRRRVRFERRVLATAGAAAICRVVPARFDPLLARVVAQTFARIRPRRMGVFKRRIAQMLVPDHLSAAAVAPIAREYLDMRVEVRWARSRGIVRPHWSPETSIDGLEHVEDALAAGTGAILWCGSFVDHFPRNAALAASGHPAIHLSSRGHLIPTAATDRRTLEVSAPFLRRAEDRPLLQRVEIPREGGLGYLRELRRALEHNHVVSIVGDLTSGSITTPVRVAQRDLAFPTGAPSLARATGAPLLPTITVREAPFRYRIVIEPDISPDRSLPKAAYRVAASEAFAARLTHHLTAHTSSAQYWGTRG